MKIITSLFNGFLFWIFLATIFGYFSRNFFLADICTQFRFQYFIFGIIAVAFYLLIKERNKFIYILLLTTICFNLAEILVSFNACQQKSRDFDFSIAEINLLTSNANYSKMTNEILRLNPDILIIEEIDSIWSEKLSEIKKNYPYSCEHTREDNFGIAIYSKIPVKNFKLSEIGNLNTPIISAICEVKNKQTEIIAIHTTPPTCKEYFENTKDMLTILGKYAKENKIPTIIAGDINTTVFSVNYKNFIKLSNMKDCGNLFNVSWSSFWLLPMRIKLDHIFVSKDIILNEFKTGYFTGSDHYPVYAKLKIED